MASLRAVKELQPSEIKMEAQEIVKLTPDSIRDLIASQGVEASTHAGRELRRETRWPFPGTVEVWLPDSAHGERHLLTTLQNISINGLAMSSGRAIHSGTRVSFAVHLPEMSCYGEALVRHCTRSTKEYLVGIEFIFEAPQDDDSD